MLVIWGHERESRGRDQGFFEGVAWSGNDLKKGSSMGEEGGGPTRAILCHYLQGLDLDRRLYKLEAREERIKRRLLVPLLAEGVGKGDGNELMTKENVFLAWKDRSLGRDFQSRECSGARSFRESRGSTNRTRRGGKGSGDS